MGSSFRELGPPLSYFHAIFEKSPKTLYNDEADLLSIGGRKQELEISSQINVAAKIN